MISDLRKTGHVPSLVAGLVHFEASFMCWVLVGALGIAISADLGLAPWQKGIAVGVPLVAGSMFRLMIGPLVDRKGPRPIGMITLVATAIAVITGWLFAHSLPQLLGVGVLLGVAGSSFAVSLPLAGRAFDAKHRGLAMGIAGAGNSGTVVAALVAPRLATRYGWHAVLGLALIPIATALALFIVLTRHTPSAAPGRAAARLRSVWSSNDARSLSVLYLVTFGGFVGSVSFLPILLHDQYGVSPSWAAIATAICAGAGSIFRPVGGTLADRLGGERVLPFVFVIAATALGGVAARPSAVGAVALFTITVGMLGVGNGAVFQIVPRLFPENMGAVTGLVGAAGGLGGFLLPFVLGLTKTWTGAYSVGLLAFSGACLLASTTLIQATRRWSLTLTRLVPSEAAA